MQGVITCPADGNVDKRADSMPMLALSQSDETPVSGDSPTTGPMAGVVPMAGVGASSTPNLTSGLVSEAHRMGPHQRVARLRQMVDRHIDFVARVLRNAGTPDAEIDDDVQRTFIVAAKRLDDVRPGAEKSFLLQIALRMAAHARRTVARRREVPADEAIEMMENVASPEQLTDQKRARQMLDHVLDSMDSDLRTVFVLYEFEEMNMTEIAGILGIPRGTVASRLRRARGDFRDRVSALERSSESKVKL